MGLKQEMEVAMKLLEKDTHEKQDTLAALRLQLDQVKTLNLQMFQKAQVSPSQAAPNPQSDRTRHQTNPPRHHPPPPQDSQQEAERKQAKAVQLEQRMNDMEKVIVELEQRWTKWPLCVQTSFP